MKKDKIPYVYLVIICLAILVVPNLSMVTRHTYDSVENTLFSGESVYDVHLKIKNLAVVVFGVITLLILMFDVIVNRLKFNLFKVIFATFSVIVLLTAVFSQYQEIVWDGVYQYYENALSFLSYFAFLMAAARVTSLKEYNKYIKFSVYTSVVVAFAQGFTQYIGINVFNWPIINQFIGSIVNAETLKLNTNAASGILAGLDNSNFLGSFIVLPLSISLLNCLKGNKLLDWMIYFISIWMLIASNSAAGAIGFMVMIALIGLTQNHDNQSLVKAIVPTIVVLGINVILNKSLGKMIVYDFNQYAIIFLGLLVCTLTMIVRRISKENLRKIVLVGLAIVFLGVGLFGVLFTDVLKDKMVDKKFTSFEASESTLTLFKGDIGLRFNITESTLSLKEFPSNKDVLFVEGDILFDQTEHFKNFGGTYEITDEGVLARIGPLDLVMLFRLNKIYYQDMYGWREITNVSSADAFGFEEYKQFASSRGYIWSRTLPLLNEHLLWGNGPDTFMFEYPQEDFEGKLTSGFSQFTIIDKPHNLFLRYWVQFGFIALALFLGGVIWISWEGLRKNVAVPWIIALLAVLGTGMFNDIIAGISFLIYILIGLIIGELENHKELMKA